MAVDNSWQCSRYHQVVNPTSIAFCLPFKAARPSSWILTLSWCLQMQWSKFWGLGNWSICPSPSAGTALDSIQISFQGTVFEARGVQAVKVSEETVMLLVCAYIWDFLLLLADLRKLNCPALRHKKNETNMVSHYTTNDRCFHFQSGITRWKSSTYSLFSSNNVKYRTGQAVLCSTAWDTRQKSCLLEFSTIVLGEQLPLPIRRAHSKCLHQNWRK